MIRQRGERRKAIKQGKNIRIIEYMARKKKKSMGGKERTYTRIWKVKHNKEMSVCMCGERKKREKDIEKGEKTQGRIRERIRDKKKKEKRDKIEGEREIVGEIR